MYLLKKNILAYQTCIYSSLKYITKVVLINAVFVFLLHLKALQLAYDSLF